MASLHPPPVAEVLADFGIDGEVMQVCAWLHDILEDTKVKKRDLEEQFGDEIANIVWAVTSEEGANRKIRNALTYPKIRAAGPAAIALKLADRIANVENGGRAVEMYRKEHAEFRHGIYLTDPDEDDEIESIISAMQDTLDDLLQ